MPKHSGVNPAHSAESAGASQRTYEQVIKKIKARPAKDKPINPHLDRPTQPAIVWENREDEINENLATSELKTQVSEDTNPYLTEDSLDNASIVTNDGSCCSSRLKPEHEELLANPPQENAAVHTLPTASAIAVDHSQHPAFRSTNVAAIALNSPRPDSPTLGVM